MQPNFSQLKPVEDQPNFSQLKPLSDMTKPKATGLQAFVQDIARPFLKLTSTASDIGAQALSLGADIIGRHDIAQKIDINRAKNEGIDYGYFGNVKPMGQTGTLQDVKEAVGVGADIGSYAVGGGGATSAAKLGLKGLVKQGIKEGVKTGALSGGLMSFGQSLQDAESSPSDVAYNTLFGTALGGVAGGVLGGVTPVAVKGFNLAKGYTKIPELENKLAEGFKKIFNPTARQVKADTRFGNDSFKFLAQEIPDLPIDVNSAGRIEADSAIEMAKMKYAAEATAYKPIIRNSGKYIDIDQTIANAKANARKEFDGSDLIKAEKQIDDEVNAYLANSPQDINVTADGKRFVTLARADDIKSYSWARGKGWGTPDAEVWNDTNNIIGHAIKDSIEKELPNAPIKAMNRRLGQWKNAIDILEKRNGQVSGSGGKLSKYFIKSVGTSVGAGLGGNDNGIGGGLVGAGGGFMTATALASMMANPKVRLFAIRKLLQNLNKAGRSDLIQEAEQILQEQASKYLLPAAGKTSYIEKPILVAGAGQNLDNIGTRPIAKSAQKGVQSAYGGLAGIEITTDENGDIKVNFNPEKALVGIVGATAYNKIPAKLKAEALDTMRIFKDFKSSDFVKNGKLNIEAWNAVSDLFEKSAKGTVTKDDIRTAQEVHFLLKGKKDVSESLLTADSKLLQEAKKYKSAEEFVKAQGEPVYRASAGGFDASKIGSDGTYVTPSETIAKSFSEGGKRTIEEFYISPSAKVLEWKNVPEKFKNFDGKDIQEVQSQIAKYAKANGYDVVASEPKFEYGRGIEQQVVNPKVLHTKSQLTEIWNKANKK